MTKIITTDEAGAILHSIQVDEFNMNIPQALREQAAMLRMRQAAFMAETALLLSQILPGVSFSMPSNEVDATGSGSFISSSFGAWPTKDDEEIPMLLACIDTEGDWEPRKAPPQTIQNAQVAPAAAPQKPKSPSPGM